MKKLFLLFIAVLVFVGCGGGDSDEAYERTPTDIDLTVLSVTMVSAQAFQMRVSPEDFLGQTVRIRGSHYTFPWDEAGMDVHYVVLDLTAGCCGEAFEFILTDELIESVGYPPHGAIIEVVGVFSSYEMFGLEFHYLYAFEINVE